MKKYLILIIFTIVGFSSLYSQSDSTQMRPKHFTGITAGITTGLGAYYRYMPDIQGIQVSFIPIYTRNTLYDRKVSFGSAFSGTYLNRFATRKRIDFNFYESQMIIINDSDLQNFTIGAGTMADVKLGYDMNMSINLGLAFIVFAGDSSEWVMLPDIGLGFSYKF